MGKVGLPLYMHIEREKYVTGFMPIATEIVSSSRGAWVTLFTFVGIDDIRNKYVKPLLLFEHCGFVPDSSEGLVSGASRMSPTPYRIPCLLLAFIHNYS